MSLYGVSQLGTLPPVAQRPEGGTADRMGRARLPRLVGEAAQRRVHVQRTASPSEAGSQRYCNTPGPSGEPPYSVGQGSANDLNANLSYPTLDSRIADTYAKLSPGANKNSLYHSYLRAFRWSTDHIRGRGFCGVRRQRWLDQIQHH